MVIKKNQAEKLLLNIYIFFKPLVFDLPYTNNSSKELISDIEQLINNLYDNEQITKQVYNNLNKAITYKNDS